MNQTEPRGRHERPEPEIGRHEAAPNLLPWHLNATIPASADGPTLGDRTPPVPWPALVPQPSPIYWHAPPVQPSSAGAVLARVGIAAAIAFVSLILGALILLTVALIAGPPPADASTPQQQASSRTTTERVVVAGDSVTLVVGELCKAEDDCTIDYRGKGRWVITRTEH